MYGVTEANSGGGGLAAQLPAPDLYFPQATAIADPGVAAPGGTATNGVTGVAYSGIARQTPKALANPSGMNDSGTAATTPVSQMHPSWRSVLDFHNSPAPWILIMILLLFGWIHVSVRASGRAGKGRIGGGAFL